MWRQVCDFWGWISTDYAQLSHGNTPIITRYHSVRSNQLSARRNKITFITQCNLQLCNEGAINSLTHCVSCDSILISLVVE